MAKGVNFCLNDIPRLLSSTETSTAHPNGTETSPQSLGYGTSSAQSQGNGALKFFNNSLIITKVVIVCLALLLLCY